MWKISAIFDLTMINLWYPKEKSHRYFKKYGHHPIFEGWRLFSEANTICINWAIVSEHWSFYDFVIQIEQMEFYILNRIEFTLFLSFIFYFILFFGGGVLGIELRTTPLQGRYLCLWAKSLVTFYKYLKIRLYVDLLG